MEYITASGAVEQPIGVTKIKINFTLARGTDKECKAEIPVTIVNT